MAVDRVSLGHEAQGCVERGKGVRMNAVFRKCSAFARELETARWLRRIAATRGTELTIEQAHEAWAEHSDYYCAQWLAPDAENPTAEAWRAIEQWKARRMRK